MKRLACIAAAAFAVGGCGSGLEGTLAWKSDPVAGAHAVSGSVRNTTSHPVSLDPKAMRFLDSDGRKVAGRIRTGTARLAAHASTTLRGTWKSGKPVRIDYGTGTLALPSE
ncbi:MAG: hypothetical protein ACJ77Z_08240 [Thermoleophilaceae bacterium]